MDNQISLSKKDNPDLQELVSDKGAGERVKMTVTFLIAENSDDRLVGTIEEVEGQEVESEPEETPAVKVAKRGVPQET